MVCFLLFFLLVLLLLLLLFLHVLLPLLWTYFVVSVGHAVYSYYIPKRDFSVDSNISDHLRTYINIHEHSTCYPLVFHYNCSHEPIILAIHHTSLFWDPNTHLSSWVKLPHPLDYHVFSTHVLCASFGCPWLYTGQFRFLYTFRNIQTFLDLFNTMGSGGENHPFIHIKKKIKKITHHVKLFFFFFFFLTNNIYTNPQRIISLSRQT